MHNEQKVMVSLVSICDQHLNAYPTSYESDVQKLNHGNVAPFSNERHALIQASKHQLFYSNEKNKKIINVDKKL